MVGIRGGRIVDPVNGKELTADLLLDNGRIVSVGETYTCIGDNQFVYEPGVAHSQVLALVTAFYRGNRKWDVTSPWYCLYCRFWHYTRPVRHFWRRGMASDVLCASIAMMVYEFTVFGLGLFGELTNWYRWHIFLFTGIVSVLVMLPLYPLVSKIGAIGGETWKE